MLESTELGINDLNSIFTVMPQKGSLYPNDRPTPVQFIFRHNKEVSIKEQQILRCQVMRPSLLMTSDQSLWCDLFPTVLG